MPFTPSPGTPPLAASGGLRRRRLLAALAAAAGLALTRTGDAQARTAPKTRGQGGPRALQLAGLYRPGLDLREWWVSEKLDGVRGYWDGQRLWTRGGARIEAPAWFTAGWPAQPMDGELWAGRNGFSQAQSTVARHGAGDAAWGRLRYVVFDLPAHGGPFDARQAALQALLAHKPAQATLEALAQRRVASEAELQALLQDVVRGGGEGLMLAHGGAPYRAGRSEALLKLKTHHDAEARVVAHLPGRGRHAGRLGALLVETADGKRFRLGSGFTDAQRANPPPIGSWVTYRHRGVHASSGLPRFASFVRVRDDEPRNAR